MSIAVGLFGLAEIIRNLEHRPSQSVVAKKVKGLWLSRDDFRRIRMPVLRGTAMGSALGVLPGGGHVLAAFTSYSVARSEVLTAWCRGDMHVVIVAVTRSLRTGRRVIRAAPDHVL